MMFIGLSENGRKFWGFIWRGIEEGKTGAAIWRELKREFGTVYRLKDFYRDVRYLKEVYRMNYGLRFVRDDRIPSPERFELAFSRSRKPYCIKFRVEGFNKRTEQYEAKFVTLGYENLKKMGEMKQDVRNLFRVNEMKEDGSPPFEIHKIVPIMAYYACWAPIA